MEGGARVQRVAQLRRGQVGVPGPQPVQLAGQYAGAAGRERHRCAGGEGGDEDEEGAAQYGVVGGRVDERTDGGHAGGQAGAGVDHGARAGGGAGGEDDHRVGVVVAVGRETGARRPAVEGGRAAREPSADGGHRAQLGQVREGEAGPAGQRAGPAGHRLGGRVGQDQRGPGQRQPGAQHVRPGARVEHGAAQPQPPQGEQHGQGAGAGPHGDADGVPGAQPAGVQGGGERVGECGEFAAGGADAGRAGAGGGQDGGPVGAGAQRVVEAVEHQRGSVPREPLPWSRYQRAVPASP